jgi:ATP-binding cassette subfamily G (WHITE) protein 2 (SNQ2)
MTGEYDDKASSSGHSSPIDSPMAPMSPTFKDDHEHVSVAKAEAEFAQLDLELRNAASHASTRRVTSRVASKVASRGTTRPQDLEKGDTTAEDEEPFSLEATLRGDRAVAEDEGFKFKEIGVSWRDLTVRGVGGGKKIYVKTFPQAFIDFVDIISPLRKLFSRGSKLPQADILRRFRGVVKPGEMVLVLGRPGSGCTTFLKVISNQRFGFTGFDGDVKYGPFTAEEFAKRYRGEAVFNAEDEAPGMLPTLTVEQTLDFALDTKVPGKRPAGLSRTEFKQKVITLLLRMFNIRHTRKTFVGGPFVRGVSGGERKRVAIAEMMITNACICAWDNPTRGLDASTAVDYIRSIRVLSDIHKTSTFITAYQISESIYREFDKVMVIDQGRQVYFGPAKQARAYFESLGFLPKPRQTTADYLTGCTDPFEREYKPEFLDSPHVPRTPDHLAAAFEKSKFSSELDEEISNYQDEVAREVVAIENFHHAMKDSKRRASPGDVYSIPLYLQIWALIKRQFILKKQDTFSLTVSWTTMMLIGLLLSTNWVNQPLTSAGAFTRGGVIFISFLFNGFQAFGELGSVILGRPVVSKHRSYTFYRPSALWFAQVFVDMAFQSVAITAFCIMVYFSVHLAREVGAFFTYWITILTGYLCMTLIFRTIALLSRDFDVAIRSASMLIAFLVLTSGYPIQYAQQKVWIRWLFWINPVGLGFSSLMMNEFKRISLQCIDASLVPSGSSYTDINHQVCTLLGSIPGNPIVVGKDYIKAQFGYIIKDEWRNYSLIIVLIIFFLSANVFMGELINWGASGRTITFFARENKELKELNKQLQERKSNRSNKDGGQNLSISIESKSVLTWEAVNYDVPVPNGTKRILSDVFGFIRPGELTALMGASGAGKTTLLDVLAARKNIGVIHGDILVDGEKPGIGFQRATSYAEQQDVHEPAQTVREALRFSADLRQPYETSQEEKYAYVEEVIGLLELEDVADAIIGSAEAGLPPYQRKLLTIGIELAAKPQLLLFLDEPTTGLDSQSAWNIARFLRKLSAAGQAILCTIHQPNSALFQQFDRLLLLQKGGECVYFGEIGPDASTLRDYFKRNGVECPPAANPAEWMLDAIGAGLTARLGDRDWGDVWAESPELEDIKEEIIRLKHSVLPSTSAQPQQEYATPTWHQTKHVVYRQSLSFWRSPAYGFTRFFNHIAIALIAGFVFLQLDNSRASLQGSIFLIFQFTVLPAIILAQVQPKYAIARMISYREQAAKAYRTVPFALSMILAEVPYSFLCALTFFIPIYFIPGLNLAPDRAGYQFLMTLIMELFSVVLGQMVAAMTPSPKIASLLNPPIIITFALFSGVTVPPSVMPKFWHAWLYPLDPFSRLIGGMLVTELHGREVVCKPSELNVFTAPDGVNCGSYMASYFANGGPGYLVNNNTQSCEYCAYSVGDQFYEPLGYDFGNRWRDLGILSAYIGSSIILILIAVSILIILVRFVC